MADEIETHDHGSQSPQIQINKMSFANQNKNTTVLTNQPLGPTSDGLTWDEAEISWDDIEGTWDNPRSVYSNQNKNTTVLTNQAKNV